MCQGYGELGPGCGGEVGPGCARDTGPGWAPIVAGSLVPSVAGRLVRVPSASTQSRSNAGNCSVSAALGSASGIAEPPVPYNEPCTSGDMPCVQVAFL